MSEEQVDQVMWTALMPHPKYKVVSAEEEGTWRPAPGYKWATDPPDISQVEWTPGLKHPEKNLVAGEKDGEWVPAPGYTWSE